MPGGIIKGVASAVGFGNQNNASKDAASATAQGNAQATQLQREIYNDQRNLLSPSITAGADARARQMLMEGYTPDQVKTYLSSTASAVNSGAQANATDLQSRYPDLYRSFAGGDTVYGQRYSNFTDYLNATGVDTSNSNATASTQPSSNADYSWVDNYQYAPSSPSYQFRLDQGSKALQRSAAAGGNLFSGQTGQALTDYGQNAASQEFEADYRRLGDLAGAGTDATGTTVNVAGNYGTSAANNAQNTAAARASGYINSSNAFTNGLSGVSAALGAGYGYGKQQGWWGG